jgi:hypothetical protein
MLMGAPPIPVTVTLVTERETACATGGPADTHMNIAMTAMDRTDNSLTFIDSPFEPLWGCTSTQKAMKVPTLKLLNCESFSRQAVLMCKGD